ncbi:MAG: P-loop NTPase [Dehalococcoidales bacterium]|nr:P-loop NTPase [Dehalococcoidales bacterium]
MITEEQIKTSLREVFVPEVERSIIDLNLVRKITIIENKVTVTLASTALSPEVQEFISAGIKAAMQKSKIKDVIIEFVEAKPAELNEVKNVIAVMSGKGGVGKSAVTAMLAIALKRLGKEVGILDADITGSSIPRMFGINARPMGSETGLMPVVSESGIEVMSMNLLLPQEDSAVIWRAPLLSKAISQFWEDVVWGKLDYLLIDLPPGTADAPLTVMQSLPVTGIIIVSTPQGLVEMIVKKAINMAQKMNKPILGIVENMSYFYVPELKKKFELFGESKGEALAKAAQAPLLGKLSIDPEFARLSDKGDIEHYSAESVASLGKALLTALETRAG